MKFFSGRIVPALFLAFTTTSFSQTPAFTAAQAQAGRAAYAQHCAVCHGDDGKGGHTGGAPLDRVADLAAAIQTVTAGRNNMPPFRNAFTAEQIRDVSAYVVQTLASRPPR